MNNSLTEKIDKIKDVTVKERVNKLVENYITSIIEKNNVRLMNRIQNRIAERLQYLDCDESKLETVCKLYFYIYSGNRNSISGLSRFFLLNKDLKTEEIIKKYENHRLY
jgi:hypothetical protein